MNLRVKVGSCPAQVWFIPKLQQPPRVGESFEILDKVASGSRFRVRLREIRTHVGGGDIYFVDLV